MATPPFFLSVVRSALTKLYFSMFISAARCLGLRWDSLITMKGIGKSLFFTFSLSALTFHFCAGVGFIPFMLINITAGSFLSIVDVAEVVSNVGLVVVDNTLEVVVMIASFAGIVGSFGASSEFAALSFGAVPDSAGLSFGIKNHYFE